MKALLPKEIKARTKLDLVAFLKLDREIKTLTSEKNEIKLQLQATLDEFGLDKLVLINGTLTMVKGSTRNSIADWGILEDVLEKNGIDSSLIIKQSVTKPSLRVTSHK